MDEEGCKETTCKWGHFNRHHHHVISDKIHLPLQPFHPKRYRFILPQKRVHS